MEERKWQASIFGGLWAVAHLGHFLFRGAPADPVVWAIVLAAMAVLYRPGEAWRLGVLAAIQVVDMLWSQPMVDNHYLIMGAVNMGILFSLLFARADRGEPALTLSFAYIRNAFWWPTALRPWPSSTPASSIPR